MPRHENLGRIVRAFSKARWEALSKSVLWLLKLHFALSRYPFR